MNLVPVFIDYETYWSQTHSLTKLNPIVYVTHPETEIISCAVKVGRGDTQVLFGEGAIGEHLRGIDWSDKLLIAHNNEGFDAMLSAWRYGTKPAMWGCTLAMARPRYAKVTSLGLNALGTHLGLGGKKNGDVLVNTRGKHLADFTPEEILNMMVYNNEDTELCARIFLQLVTLTSKREMNLIDQTIRMLVEPKFVVDTALLQHTYQEEQARKASLLQELAHVLEVEPHNDIDPAHAVRALLSSSKKFAELLALRGGDVPMKPSPTNPEKDTYALAKTDQAFLDLMEHDDPVVAMAAQVRARVKSTILESRIEAFLAVAGAMDGRMPIALKYAGADTTQRWSGAMGLNQQNLPRIPRDNQGNIIDKPTNALRLCLKAPPGYKVVVADLSGIELRVNMFLWKVPYAMELFQADPEKADLYKALASEVMGVPIEGMPTMVRQAGKAMHLGCGFGLGTASKYVAVAKTMAGVIVTEDEAKEHIAGYRRKHPEIVRGWKTCHAALPAIYQGARFDIDPWGMCYTNSEGIVTPRGMILYPHLRQEVGDDGKEEWWYGEGRHKARIYAGKVTENCVQHLARCIIADDSLQVEKETGYAPALMVHDELVYIVPEAEAEAHLETVQRIMRTPPTWWPELVVYSEGDIADSYGEAK